MPGHIPSHRLIPLIAAQFGHPASMIAVIGTGTWGCASGVALLRAGADEVHWWGRRPDFVAQLARERRHPHLPGHELPDGLRPNAVDADLAGASLLLWAVPTQASRAVARRLAAHVAPDALLVSLAKGLEEDSLATVCQILEEELPGRRIICLSGPSHAEEVIAARPAALVAAGADRDTIAAVAALHAPPLRIYTGADRLGVELAGACKNVIAIAAGLCQGLELGHNASAALLTRGLAEMRRLGRALGADDATFAGLAGIGDLITTCYAPHGRNRALGLALACGGNPATLTDGQGMVAEGAWTAGAMVALGARHGIELPIASQVASVLWQAKPVQRAMDELLARAAKEEHL